MRISAVVENSRDRNDVTLRTDARTHSINIPAKETGMGSSVNGGELLFLALATCYCNDIYREAAKRGIQIESVQVEVEGEFGAAGDPATNVTYKAHVVSNASQAELEALMKHTDTVAEIQNTLRRGAPVVLAQVNGVSVG